MSIETHPNWFYDFKPMKTLVLGSFPPHQSKHSFPFYYPNKQNRFWKVMSVISGIELVANLSNTQKVIEERKAIMRKLAMGIHDIALKIKRKNNSSLDSNIEIVEFQDIMAIINNHPELEQIVLLGFSAKNSAAQNFIKYTQNQKLLTKFPIDFKIGSENVFFIYNQHREIKCVILNSTSSASRITLNELVSQFSKYI
ncbi:uracil-DNA glycosylase family protein [Flavobacterium terrae]|uniref:G/U mismatch-specific uracil-DNA glycosylase n=1 Tax=Flavobacterium terrae TaxID=415425 RepID=A0A1M6GLX5_9FLAO|nr:uracil-DNA glycosylase family protein [Flavobacterium terrae]SHJ10921.1 G/U mismatch-specific uracil-DNA glycosylase [Flavobacterium terrae]